MQTLDGEVKGRHDGLMYYTIGQRHGLGIGGAGEPWFVCGKNLEKNILYVCQGFDNEALYSDALVAINVNFINPPEKDRFQCTAKVRYRQPDREVEVERLSDDAWKVYFKQPERAVTPGQAVVFYDGEVCLGGGIIDEVYKNEQKLEYV
jgi:tRNA-specific 2-thiouridylase